ncbi:MAG: hypothetical protein IPI55_08275 [Flavobacteriales bacterium]|nr:hypothetical protein [Flavobacteriales bacterium]
MVKIVKVVVRLRGRSALAKLDLARYVVSQMTGNINFAGLAAQVTALGSAADALESAITAANSRDIVAVGQKQLAEVAVMDLLSKLCDSVNGIAAGDMAKLLTCGFPLRRENTPIGELPPAYQGVEQAHQHHRPRGPGVHRFNGRAVVQCVPQHLQRSI